ncbi:MAG: YegS/Rv2252/BmrU family lipid kinase [bacterium]|nr:YegS/Rv2252/BmrU family lipid kinase [bacterium]
MTAHWWVIANPYSGKKGEVAERARAALESKSMSFDLAESRSPNHLAELVQQGVAAGATHFAGVGGDGTAHLIVNALMKADLAEPPTLAILPAGSGSDFIRTFALPRRIEEAVDHLATDADYPCDVGLLSGGFGERYFLNVADIGVAAASVGITERLPRWLGTVRYGIGFWLTLARFPTATVRLTAGKRTYEGPAINVVAANGQYFGGGMNVAPNASVMDGMFDLQVFEGPRRLAFSIMPRVVRGTHIRHKAVRHFVADSFRLECDHAWPVEADGEVLGRGPLTGRILRNALRFKI